MIAQKLGETMKATVVVENRTGAGGAIGAAEAAAAAPDGHTLLLRCLAVHDRRRGGEEPRLRSAAFRRRSRPSRSVRSAFVVGKDVPVNSMREFVALARNMPGKLNYGSAGAGSVNHLALELLNARAGIVVVHVPYRGIADATKDLLGGSIQAMTASIPAALPLAADKRVKVLRRHGPQAHRANARRADVGGGRHRSTRTSSTTGASSRRRARRARSSRDSTRTCGRCSPSPTCASASSVRAPSSCLARPSSWARSIEGDLAHWKKLIVEAKLSFE